jgi:hypothetical protein
MSGSGMCLPNHSGWYQSLDPMMAMTAGISVSRTTKASRSTGTRWRTTNRAQPECLPELVDLTDEELREALQTMLLHMLRVPSGPRE